MPALNAVLAWQRDFYPRWHATWGHLQQPHTRALAWLLSAPDLLDANAAQWGGMIANLNELGESDANQFILQWEQQLAQGQSLPEGLAQQTRLGRYAEKLLGYYFSERQSLFAAGLQVKRHSTQESGKALSVTVGEFDFLLNANGVPCAVDAARAANDLGLWHWELATKFYLFAQNLSNRATSDYFLGPNLADSLGAKMQKILQRQLALGSSATLPHALLAAKALIKGWLFYPFSQMPLDFAQLCLDAGLAAQHCRGFWCSCRELPQLAVQLEVTHLLPLERLAWFAPACVAENEPQLSTVGTLLDSLEAYFASEQMPRLCALMQLQDGVWREVGRVFVVPNDWQQRADSVYAGRG